VWLIRPRSAWKGSSAPFGCRAFSEVRWHLLDPGRSGLRRSSGGGILPGALAPDLWR
jgi:hypothetical protein